MTHSIAPPAASATTPAAAPAVPPVVPPPAAAVAAPAPASSPGKPGPAEAALPLVSDAQVALAERSVGNVEKIRLIALRVTRENDWTDVGGRPYLNSSGALKVAALFGVSLTGMRVGESRERIDGKEVIRYVARTTARFLGRRIEVEGVASSDESFFARRNGEAIPLGEVNLNAVRKKAVTNAQTRAVKAILGLGGLTWEEVRGAGVEKAALAAVGFPKAGGDRKSDDQRGGAPARPAVSAQPGAPATRAAASRAKIRLRNMLVDIASFEDITFERALRHYTQFRGEDGRSREAESIDAMSEAWVARTIQRAEPDWKAIPLRPGPGHRAAVLPAKEVAS